MFVCKYLVILTMHSPWFKHSINPELQQILKQVQSVATHPTVVLRVLPKNGSTQLLLVTSGYRFQRFVINTIESGVTCTSSV
jgi:hypothetical protein